MIFTFESEIDTINPLVSKSHWNFLGSLTLSNVNYLRLL